jgi:hypothetical protein
MKSNEALIEPWNFKYDSGALPTSSLGLLCLLDKSVAG